MSKAFLVVGYWYHTSHNSRIFAERTRNGVGQKYQIDRLDDIRIWYFVIYRRQNINDYQKN